MVKDLFKFQKLFLFLLAVFCVLFFASSAVKAEHGASNTIDYSQVWVLADIDTWDGYEVEISRVEPFEVDGWLNEWSTQDGTIINADDSYSYDGGSYHKFATLFNTESAVYWDTAGNGCNTTSSKNRLNITITKDGQKVGETIYDSDCGAEGADGLNHSRVIVPVSSVDEAAEKGSISGLLEFYEENQEEFLPFGETTLVTLVRTGGGSGADNNIRETVYEDRVGFVDSGGSLEISNLDPGTYELTATYNNPSSGADADGGQYQITETNIVLESGEDVTLGTVRDAQERTGPTDTGEASTEEAEPECRAGSFGWLICAGVELLISVVDWIQNNIIIPFLTISPLDASDGDPVYEIWKSIRVLANALLGVVFLVIIFAQVASINIDAYAIRKILPRLLIATVAIQISFFLVGYMVDIVAVIGNGIGDLVTTPLQNANVPNFTVADEGGGTAVLYDFGAILAAGGAIYGAILAGGSAIVGTLFLVLLAALPVFLMVFFTLIFRQVLVVLLAIASPIAFALWILPNTEGLFKKWWSTLMKALFMYPLIVLLFAGGVLVAAVASAAFGGFISTVIAIGAIIAPLAMIPMTFKFAGGAISGFANMVQSLSQRAFVGEKGEGGLRKAVAPHVEKRRQRFASGTNDEGFVGSKAGSLLGLNKLGEVAARPGANKFGGVAKSGAIMGFNQKTAEIGKEFEDAGIQFDRGVMLGIANEDTTGLDSNESSFVNRYKNNPAAKAAAVKALAGAGLLDSSEQSHIDAVNNLRSSLDGNSVIQGSVMGEIGSKMGKTDLAFDPLKLGNAYDPSSADYQKALNRSVRTSGHETWSGIKRVSQPVVDSVDRVLSGQDPKATKEVRERLIQNMVRMSMDPTVGPEKQAAFEAIVKRHASNYPQAVQQAKQMMNPGGGQGGGGQGGSPQNPNPPTGGGGGQGNPPQNPPGGAGQGGGQQGGPPQSPPGGGQSGQGGGTGGIVTPNSPNWQNPNSSNLPGGKGGNQGGTP